MYNFPHYIFRFRRRKVSNVPNISGPGLKRASFLVICSCYPFPPFPPPPLHPLSSLFLCSHFLLASIHGYIKITDRTPGVVFSRFMCVSFTITLRQKPKGVTHSLRRTELQDRDCERNTHKSKKRHLVSYLLF